MGQQATCDGTINAQPSTVTDGSFPAGSTSIPFTLNPPSKPFNVDTGRQLLSVNSPSAFVAAGAIGPNGAVTAATFLYLRTQSPMSVRVTQASVARVFLVSGLLVLEPQSGSEITLVEFEGAGTVEMYACGQQ